MDKEKAQLVGAQRPAPANAPYAVNPGYEQVPATDNAHGLPPQRMLVAQAIPVARPVAGIPIYLEGGEVHQIGQFDLQPANVYFDITYESLTTCPKCCIIAFIVILLLNLLSSITSFTRDGCFLALAYAGYNLVYSLFFIFSLWRLYNAIREKSPRGFERSIRYIKFLFVLSLVQVALAMAANSLCKDRSISSFAAVYILILILQEVAIYYFFYSARRILCLLYTSPSPRDRQKSRMPSSA
eukprot:TRINITY_DN20592_c0_g1_i1.p1 TRINITY_DN20592_c0_g1~~TRINITY_DN20592_c0_g1_i1.p1  ORF type:complete len:241 (-),score=34.49 TRINITY_DN20592_c0_g1_i1:10-732(-)